MHLPRTVPHCDRATAWPSRPARLVRHSPATSGSTGRDFLPSSTERPAPALIRKAAAKFGQPRGIVRLIALPSRPIHASRGRGGARAILDRHTVRYGPAVAAGHQRKEHLQPSRPARPAAAHGVVPPGQQGLHRSAQASRRAARATGWCASTGGPRFTGDRLPRRRAADTLLAGRAHQPPARVLAPARGKRPGPVVGFAERGGVRERRAAACHVAPGGRDADLVTNDTVFGDRDRVNQRVTARRQPERLPVGWRAGGSQLSHPASPALRGRPPCVPWTRLCAHPSSPHRYRTRHIRKWPRERGDRRGLSGADRGSSSMRSA